MREVLSALGAESEGKMLKQNGRYERNGTEYLKGAEWAGLTCWLEAGMVAYGEAHLHVSNHGDHAKDEIIRYLSDPDTYKRDGGILITDDRMKLWPLRNTHKRPSGDAQREHVTQGSTEPKAPVDSAAGSPAQPSDKGDEWPRYSLCSATDGRGVRYQQLFVFTAFNRADVFYCANSTICDDTRVQRGYKTRWDYEARKENETDGMRDLDVRKGIPPTEAAKWLRENGHEAEAAKIEADDPYEPVGTMPVVGDRVVDLRYSNCVLSITNIHGCEVTKSNGYIVGNGVFRDAPELHEHRILKRRIQADTAAVHPKLAGARVWSESTPPSKPRSL